MARRIVAAVLSEAVKAFVRRAVGPLSERLRSYRAVPLRHAPGVRMDLVRGHGISDAIAANGVWEPDVARELPALAPGAKRSCRSGRTSTTSRSCGPRPARTTRPTPSSRSGVGYEPVRTSDPAADVAEWRAAPAG